MNRKIEFVDLKTQYADLKEVIKARIQGVLDHGQYIMGPEVYELGLKPGDKVITTPFTFAATAKDLPIYEALAHEVLSLPMSAYVDDFVGLEMQRIFKNQTV